MTKQEFNVMWSELWNRVYSKIPGVTKTLSDTGAGIVKKYLYPAGKVRVINKNLVVDENSVVARMEVERYDGSDGIATVDFFTQDGPIVANRDKKNAIAGTDYVAATGKLSWQNGETGIKFVDVTIIDDAVYEGGEIRYLTFGIKSSTGAVLGDVTKVELAIKDNEIEVPPPPPPPTTTELELELVGGWRLVGEYSAGVLAMDGTGKAWISGHAQRAELNRYDLPAMGTGTNPALWPLVARAELIPSFWSGGSVNGLKWDGNKLKVVVRNGYDTNPPPTLTIFSSDGTQEVVNLPRQRFGGFVKGVNSLELGGGGYESGQGWARGPTLAKMDGTILIDFPQTSDPLKCCPREPNYWAADPTQVWVAMGPIDGKGYWSCDRIYGGGIRHSTGIYFWAWMGTGDLDYKRQTLTFAADGFDKCYRYRFDPVTHKLIGWKEETTMGRVAGHEWSPDGKFLYMVESNYWVLNPDGTKQYVKDPVLKCYRVK